MTLRGTLGLYCVHIAQLVTHPAVYTLPFTLKLCHKPLGILQRVTKSQRVHISSHDGLQNFVTLTLLNIGPRVPQSSARVAGIHPSLTVHTCNTKNKQKCHDLLLKETLKLHQLSTSFQVILRFALRSFESSSSDWFKCI